MVIICRGEFLAVGKLSNPNPDNGYFKISFVTNRGFLAYYGLSCTMTIVDNVFILSLISSDCSKSFFWCDHIGFNKWEPYCCNGEGLKCAI